MKNLVKITAMIMVLLVGCVADAQEPGTHNVEVKQFETLVKEGKGIILDVRTPKEFAEGHIDGAVNIDYFSPNFKTEVTKLDKSKAVYVYCRSGGRSSKAVAIMQKEGFKSLYNLLGGFLSWQSVH